MGKNNRRADIDRREFMKVSTVAGGAHGKCLKTAWATKLLYEYNLSFGNLGFVFSC